MSAAAAPFRARTVAAILIAAVAALLVFLVMLAYLPQPTGGGDARGHALSVSGNGYAGLVALAEATGSRALIVRTEPDLATRALLIVTPEPGADAKALGMLLAGRGGAPTLVVLPKWWTVPIRRKPEWSHRVATIASPLVAATLAGIAPRATIEQTPFVHLPPQLPPGVPRLARARIGMLAAQQRLGGGGLVPLLADRAGRTVLARVPHRPVYILAEPDLIDNAGLADRWTARQGWQVIGDLMTTGELAFDVTLNGLGAKRSPLRAMFEPPFVAVTACLLLAALLAGAHGAIRFGGAVPLAPAMPPGKRQLVDNAALLFRAARKEHRLGRAYAALTLEAAAREAHAPAQLSGAALADWLDGARDGGDAADRYAALAEAARRAADRDALTQASRRLHAWKRNRTA